MKIPNSRIVAHIQYWEQSFTYFCIRPGGIFFTAAVLLLLFFVGCTPKSSPPASSLPENMANDQLIVLLAPNIRAKKLETAFVQYELTAKGQTSRTENRWLFTFNPSSIPIDQLLRELKQHNDVLEADYHPVKTDL